MLELTDWYGKEVLVVLDTVAALQNTGNGGGCLIYLQGKALTVKESYEEVSNALRDHINWKNSV